MLRSMFSAISGLRVHQQEMDVVGNNIANVNTVGFKSSQTIFEDTLSQVLRNGSAPSQALGGNNPAQFGLGVQLGGIATNFTQGNAQNTGRSTDFMIQGDGFFVTRAGTEQLYTRAGSFSFDGSGNMVSPDGAILQGWLADANGTIDSNAPVTDLSLHLGQVYAPQATTKGRIEGNLPADAAVGTAVTAAITMYDGQGVAHLVNYKVTKSATDQWDFQVSDGDTVLASSPTSVTFDDKGKLLDPADGKIEFTPVTAGWPGPVSLDLTQVSQYGSKNSFTASAQDGAAVGTLDSFTLGTDGTLTGIYNNGQRRALGQLALAAFNNPAGLEKVGNTAYRVAENSGLPRIGQPVSGGRGTLIAGALEMSNVDLSQEFTNLIIAQRGFQANSRVITASDEILQDLVNLKR